MKTATILKAIGCPNLSMYKGDGYWYFAYDTDLKFETHSVYVCYLNQLTLEEWVSEGMELVNNMEQAA
jgi:hypothetical protein